MPLHHARLGPKLLLLAAWLLPAEAQADAPPMGSGCYACALWVPVGLNVGTSFQPSDGSDGFGFLMGGEASVLDLREDGSDNMIRWGGYIDFLHDSHSGSWRFSAGPEVMLYPAIGFDAGAVLETGTDSTLGLRLRYFAAIPLIIPYLGTDIMFLGQDRTLFEAGLLLKLPIPLE